MNEQTVMGNNGLKLLIIHSYEFLYLSKNPNPTRCTYSGGRGITSCHTPSTSNHPIPQKNPIFICPPTGCPKVPSPPHLMKAVQAHSWRRRFTHGEDFCGKPGEWCQWWNKKCSAESCNRKCCSLSILKWQLYFLCWHLFPSLINPPENPGPETLHWIIQRGEPRECQIMMLKK